MRRLGTLEHPARCRATIRPAWLRTSSSTSMLELSGVYGPHQTFIPKGPCNGFNGDLWSFGKRALRIAAPPAFGHEVQFACGRSIFHPSYSCIAGRTSILQMVPIAMVKNHQRGALGKARRKRLRATIGHFRDRLIAPRTVVKYRASSAAFLSFCSFAGYPKPLTAAEMDLRFCEFVQHAWEEGDSRNIPVALCALSRGQLRCSQRLLRAWSKNELPMRALLAMVGAAKHKTCESRCRF